MASVFRIKCYGRSSGSRGKRKPCPPCPPPARVKIGQEKSSRSTDFIFCFLYQASGSASSMRTFAENNIYLQRCWVFSAKELTKYFPATSSWSRGAIVRTQPSQQNFGEQTIFHQCVIYNTFICLCFVGQANLYQRYIWKQSLISHLI